MTKTMIDPKLAAVLADARYPRFARDPALRRAALFLLLFAPDGASDDLLLRMQMMNEAKFLVAIGFWRHDKAARAYVSADEAAPALATKKTKRTRLDATAEDRGE